MQYNKRDIKKINDKKMMRKVKKQWVVVSVAAFAALGSSALYMFGSNNKAYASTKTESNVTYGVDSLKPLGSQSSVNTKLSSTAGTKATEKEPTSLVAGTKATGKESTSSVAGTKATGEKSTPSTAGTKATEKEPTSLVAGTKATGKESTSSVAGTKATGEKSTPSTAGTKATEKEPTSSVAGTKATGEKSTPSTAGTKATEKEPTSSVAGTKATGEKSTPSTAGTKATEKEPTSSVAETKATGEKSTPSTAETKATGEKSTPSTAGTKITKNSKQGTVLDNLKFDLNAKDKISNLSLGSSNKNLSVLQEKFGNSLSQVSKDSAYSDGEKDGIYDAQSSNTKNSSKGRNWQNYSNSLLNVQNAYITSYNDAFDGYNQGNTDYNNNSTYAYNTNNYSNKSTYYTDGYKQFSKDSWQGFNQNISGQSQKVNNLGYNYGVSVAENIRSIINNSGNNGNSNYYSSLLVFNDATTNYKNYDTNSYQYNNYQEVYFSKNFLGGFYDSLAGNYQNNNGNIAYENGNLFYKGLMDGYKGKFNNQTNDPLSVYQNAYNTVTNGFNDKYSGNNTPFDDWHAIIYNRLYNLGQVSRQAVNDFISGNGNPSNYVNKTLPSDSIEYPYVNRFYANAYQAAKDGYNNPDSIPSDYDNVQLASYLSGQYSRKALNDATQNNPIGQAYQNNAIASDVYQAAKNGYANGGTGSISTVDSSDPIYVKVFSNAQSKAQSAAKKGSNSYLQLNKSNTDTNESTNAEQTASNYGYQETQIGYQNARDNQIDSSQQNNPYYQNGIKMNADVNQGASDANNDKSKNLTYSGNNAKVSSSAQIAGYNGTFDGNQAGMKNQPKPDLSNQSQAYQDAYNKAYSNAQRLAQQIAQQNGNTAGIPLTPAQQVAQSQNAQAINQAKDDAQLADHTKDNQYKGNTNADKIYQGTQAGYANGGTGRMSQAQQNDPFYKNAFNDAQTKAQSAAGNGASQYISGKSNKPTESTQAEKDADTYGYQQAQRGYNDAKATPNQISQDKYKNDPSYKAGVDMNTAVNNGANDANKATSKDTNYGQNHNAAQTAGYDGTLDGGQAGMNGDPIPNDLNTKPQAYQDAYKKARQDAQQQAQQIAEAIAKGEPADTSKLTPAQNKAYQAAQKAIDDAKSAAADNNPAVNDSKYSGTDNASRAYQAAKAGYDNGGTGTMTSDQQADPIYSKAFNDAQTAAQKAANTGAQSYVNGNNTNNPTEGTAAERAADTYGYQQAQQGYNDAKANPNTIDPDKYKNNPSYKSGADMNTSVNNGANDANKETSKNPNYGQNHNAAQTAGYNGTLDGGQAGMNGDPTPSDLNTKPQAYQDAYKKARQDAQQQAQQIAEAIAKGESADTSKLTPAQQQAYKDAQKAIDNAKSAAADNNPTVNDSKYSGTDNASRAYQAAKAGYDNGGTGTMTPTQKADPIYSKAFTDAQTAAKAAANTGAQSYVKGNNTNNPTEGTAAEKAADNYGYQQAQAGYDAQRKGHFDNDKYTNDPSYKAGVQVANDVSNGSQAATQSNNPDPNYYPGLKNDNVAEKDAYQATKAAYQAAMNGTGKADNNNKSQAYRDAYDSAYQDANKQADAINKGNITSDRLTPGQKAAYNQAQNAMNAAINDAKNNPDANNDKYSGTDNASRAYQAAKAGYANAGNNTMDSNYNDDPVYKNAFNQAQNDARSQAAQAVKDFADGKDNNNQNGSNALGKAYDQGYNEMKAGYDGKPSTSGNDNDPSYQAGVQMAKDVKAGTTDAYDNPKQGTSYQGSLAKQEAYQATVEANKDASSEKPKSKPDASDFIRNSRSYQDAYNNAYNHASQMTKAAAAGQIDKNNLDNQLDRDAYNQGINNYQEGYQAAQAGNPSDGSKYKGKGIADLAYQGAQAGFNDGAKNLNEPKSEDPVYLNAYQNARDAARKYAKSGAQDFAQGTFKNSGASDPDEHDDSNNQDALNKAHDYGYNQAQSGYDAQQANKNKDLTNNGTPEYNIGAKMARDSDLGKKFALTGTGDSIANSDIAQRDGYQATINGYQDGANGHKQSLDGHSKAYIDAYNQAYEDGQKLAQQGASGKTDDVGLLQNNQPGQKAYAQGISDANSGYQAAVNQNGTNDDGKHSDINDSNVDKAYQGALAGFKDVGNGVNQPNNSDPVYVKAYNDANQVARSAIQAGVNEFAHGDDSSTTSEHNDPVSMAHNQGFDQAKQGYQDQMSGKADSANKNPGYIAGVQMAAEYQKAIDNTNNSPGQDGNNDPVSQATRAATLAGYSDSIHNINNSTTPNQYQSQSKVYQDAYSKAHQEAINNLKAGAEAFNNDNVAPTGNDIASMAKEQGFAAAQDAYKKAQQNSTVTPQSTDGSNYSETYNGASTAFNNALKGNYDQPTSSSDVYNSAYKKAMKEAKQLISDAAMNNIKNQNGTGSSNLSNNMISKLSDLGMNDASKAYQAAQNQEPSYITNDPNATDVYNGAKAAFDDIKNGNANKQHDSGNSLYQASYDKALQDAQMFAQNGANGYSNGQSVNDVINGLKNPTTAEKNAIQNGYNQAKAGHDDSMSGVTQPKQDNPYYNYEFENSAKSNQAGTKAAMDDATNGNEHTGNDKLDQAYQGTVDAYNNHGELPNGFDHMPVAYRDAFNAAKEKAKQTYQAGADQFNNDQPNTEANNKGATALAHNNGYQAAQSIYNQVLQNPNAVDPSNLDPAQKAGYEKAQQAIAGLQDYASGKQPTNTDSNYMAGYNIAKQATQAALNDARNGKPAQNDNVPSGMNPKLYQDIYNATYSGYNNGYNGNDNKADQGFAYKIAYQNAYKQGQYDIPAPVMPATNTAKPNRNSNKQAKQSANVDQFTNQGIVDALNGNKMKNKASTYRNGYRLGNDAIKGMRAAEYGKRAKKNIKNANDSFYMFGYNGYKAGVRAAKRTLNANKHLNKHDLVGKSQAYVYAFKQGQKVEIRRQHNWGAKQGAAMARKHHATPISLNKTHSAAYVKSYMEAYRRTMKRVMPRYIYNIRTIFVHSKTKFTKHNRVIRYVKKPRYAAKILKVTGIAYYKNGTPRYRVRGGGIIADKHGTGLVTTDGVVNAYYRHNFKHFRVIKPVGTLVHKGLKFDRSNVTRKVYHGEIFTVNKVVRYHGLTRFYLGHGEYITSNKTFVKKVG